MIVIAGLVIVAVMMIAGVAGVLVSSRRGLAARASLAQSRRETAAVSQHRDELIRQRDTTRAYTVLDEQRNYTPPARDTTDPQAPSCPRGSAPAAPARP